MKEGWEKEEKMLYRMEIENRINAGEKISLSEMQEGYDRIKEFFKEEQRKGEKKWN